MKDINGIWTSKLLKVRSDILKLMNQKGQAFLIILLIAAAIGGYLIYSGKINLNQAISQVSQPSPASTDETTNWKTYTDEVNGFSFKYPTNITPVTDNYEDGVVRLPIQGPTQVNGAVANDGLGLNFKVGVLEDKNLLGFVNDQVEKLKSKYAEINIQPMKIKINNYDGYTFTASTDGTVKFIYLANSKIYVEISMIVREAPKNQGYTKIVDQILSTFKFQ